MTPFIRDGDIVTVSSLAKFSVGTIVAFRHPETNRLIVHRITAVRNGSVNIQGDESAEYMDGWISTANLLGQVTRIEREGRNISLGMGIERYLIAYLSRKQKLSAMRRWIAQIRHRTTSE